MGKPARSAFAGGVNGQSPVDLFRKIKNGQSPAEVLTKFFEIKKAIIGDINQRKLASEALATANAKLKKKLSEQKQSRQELLLLSEMSSVLQACMSADEAYIAIVKFCQQLFTETQGVLYLIHPSHDHIERVALWGETMRQEDFFSLEECWALRRGQVHHVTNPKTDLICKHMNNYESIPNYMCMPLILIFLKNLMIRLVMMQVIWF